MAEAPKTTVFFVIAKDQEIGMFFRVIDADAFIERLDRRTWGEPKIEHRHMLTSELHPAHQNVSFKTEVVSKTGASK